MCAFIIFQMDSIGLNCNEYGGRKTRPIPRSVGGQNVPNTMDGAVVEDYHNLPVTVHCTNGIREATHALCLEGFWLVDGQLSVHRVEHERICFGPVGVDPANRLSDAPDPAGADSNALCKLVREAKDKVSPFAVKRSIDS